MHSPDNMRAPPRQPAMSPHIHPQPHATQSSRGYPHPGMASHSPASTRGRTALPSQRTLEDALWPNPMLRKMWNPENPLDLNDAPRNDAEVEEGVRERVFAPAFALDLNELVNSLWTPPKLPTPDPPSTRQAQYHRQRSGSPSPPPPPQVDEYSSRYYPDYDRRRPMPNEYDMRSNRAVRAMQDGVESRAMLQTPMEMRSNRAALPMRDTQSWHERDDPRTRRYPDQVRCMEPGTQSLRGFDPRSLEELEDRYGGQPLCSRRMPSGQHEPRYDEGYVDERAQTRKGTMFDGPYREGYDAGERDHPRDRYPPHDPDRFAAGDEAVSSRSLELDSDRRPHEFPLPPDEEVRRRRAGMERARSADLTPYGRPPAHERLDYPDQRVDHRVDRAPPPYVDPRIDPRYNRRVDPRMDPRVDPRMDRQVDPRMDRQVDPRMDPYMDSSRRRHDAGPRLRVDPRRQRDLREQAPRPSPFLTPHPNGAPPPPPPRSAVRHTPSSQRACSEPDRRRDGVEF